MGCSSRAVRGCTAATACNGPTPESWAHSRGPEFTRHAAASLFRETYHQAVEASETRAARRASFAKDALKASRLRTARSAAGTRTSEEVEQSLAAKNSSAPGEHGPPILYVHSIARQRLAIPSQPTLFTMSTPSPRSWSRANNQCRNSCAS